MGFRATLNFRVLIEGSRVWSQGCSLQMSDTGIYYVYFIHYCINKQLDTSFEFSSILSTVNLSKHSITTWIIRKFIQLVNSVTFSDVFFVSDNQVWLNLYERALSGNELFRYKVAENSFQYFSRLRVSWVIITTLYLLTPTSWYQQTAQSSGNKLLLILWHNRLP